jgi:excisionase family DNA binding protein
MARTAAEQAIGVGFVTVSTAATYLGVSRSKVYWMMTAGELPYAKFGRSRRIPRDGLMNLARRCLVARAAGRPVDPREAS